VALPREDPMHGWRCCYTRPFPWRHLTVPRRRLLLSKLACIGSPERMTGRLLDGAQREKREPQGHAEVHER